MDQTVKDILRTHFKRYPEMKIEDYVKLIYQQTFGPNHFTKKIDYVHILSYLIKEISDCKTNPTSPLIEFIGNDYYRISLQAICDGDITVHELTEMFMKSMDKTQVMTDYLKQSFLKKIEILLFMVEQKELPLDYEESVKWVKIYIKNGIQPMHHSDTYRHFYQPMYRLIHHDFIPKKIYDKFI